VAAALALGECRSSSSIPALTRALAAPFRPERIAAAAALRRAGHALDRQPSSLLDGALPVPAGIGDATRSTDVLAALADAHRPVLAGWLDTGGSERPRDDSPEAWAELLAGAPAADTPGGATAEIERYDDEGEPEYLLAKPFSRINRAQNVRLLHAFLVAAEHLRLPAGARILDLGGGSGWVSELLAKFGFTSVTLDLSSALLRIGRRRFEREGLTPKFAAADMTRLPIASASMDAALVMDALHHVPDVPAVFREVFRVLSPGGLFLIAEPGEGHSETPKSRGEMLEYGVQEREVHLFDAVREGRAAGFDDVRIVPHYVPGMTMTPEQLESAMQAPADTWMMHAGDRPGYVTHFILQAVFDRPVLLFAKGRRSADSLAPRTLRAEIVSSLARDGRRIYGRVTVRNTGDTIWLGGGHQTGHVLLGLHLLDSDRTPLRLDVCRTPLPPLVRPGESVELSVDCVLPDASTPYVVKLDLVDEGVCWFEDAGSSPVYAPV
jgi:demethylmenaquinone methyltransferase/2-methoxy-6-polyprenyl-1,4-benzoquinol methylase